jgi:hypothetical protein
MTQITENIKGYFRSNPGSDVLYFTNDHLENTGGDQFGFYSEANARNHARGLKDKEVTPITREEAMGESESEERGAEDNKNEEMLDVEVTDEVLELNPELAEEGVQVGETIQIPVDETQSTKEEILADVKEAVAKKTVKKAAAKKAPAKKAVAKKK